MNKNMEQNKAEHFVKSEKKITRTSKEQKMILLRIPY